MKISLLYYLWTSKDRLFCYTIHHDSVKIKRITIHLAILIIG